MEGILGQNRLEDVSWLCSLSESELDMLISLKSIVLQRARMIGHEELANNFDLKMLRALAVYTHNSVYYILDFDAQQGDWTLMQFRICLRFEVLSACATFLELWLEICSLDCPSFFFNAFVLMECIRDKVKDLTLAESAAFMESCNLLKYNLGDIMSLEEIRACIGINSRKGPIKRRPHKETTINPKKQKSETSKS